MQDITRDNISLFNELVEVSNRDIPPEVVAAAARRREQITPDCLKPYDLLRYSSTDELPAEIATHIETCAPCRSLLLPRIDPDLVDHAVEEAAIAAAAAIARTRQEQPWYVRFPRWVGKQLVAVVSIPAHAFRRVRTHFSSSAEDVDVRIAE